MSHTLPTPLPRFDRRLLRAVETIVPVAERNEWLRTWEAELWHAHQSEVRRKGHGARRTADRSSAARIRRCSPLPAHMPLRR